MASTLNLDDEDDFGGDVPGSQSSTKRSDGKRKFGDLDEEEEGVFGRKGKSKIEESGPGMTTGMILSLRESLQNCKANLTSCQGELEVTKSDIQKWHSAFHNGPVTPAGMSPEPGLVLTYLLNLKSYEESLKEHVGWMLEKAKKREAAFIVTFAKREQEIADLKSAVRDLKTQLRPPTMQDRYDELAQRSSGASDDNDGSESSVGNNTSLLLEASGGLKVGRIFELGSLSQNCRVADTSSSTSSAVRAKINQLIEEVSNLKELLVRRNQEMRQRDREISDLRQQQNFIMQHLQLASLPSQIPRGNGDDCSGGGDDDDNGSTRKVVTNGNPCQKREKEEEVC